MPRGGFVGVGSSLGMGWIAQIRSTRPSSAPTRAFNAGVVARWRLRVDGADLKPVLAASMPPRTAQDFAGAGIFVAFVPLW
jgi:hypothetical protein